MCTFPETYETQEEVQACYDKIVWSKQCDFAQSVLAYSKKLEFGMVDCDDLEHLKNKRRVLKILNCYNTQDILNNTTVYNTLSYDTIKDLLNC
jgi:hypothetical protein